MSVDHLPELDKLGHQLGVEPSELEFLTAVDIDDLRTLRGQIGEALFHADRHHFNRMAALAKAVPVAVAAKITVLALPPLLAARTSELFEPKKAVELVLRLPQHYLADVSAAMDPGRSPDVVAAMPPETVSAVGAELAERGEWVTMGAFVSYVNSPALRATVERLSGAQLLRIGYVLDDESRLGEISDMLREDQLDEMLAAASSESLWRELDDLLAKLDEARGARLVARYPLATDELRAAVDAAVADGSLSAGARDRLAGA